MAIRGAQAKEKQKDSKKLVRYLHVPKTLRDDANLSITVVAVKLRTLATYSGISIHRVGTLAMRPQCGHSHYSSIFDIRL